MTAPPETDARPLAVPSGFSLAATCGPVAWAGGRWPNVDWRDGALSWVGWENGLVVHRTVWQPAGAGGPIAVAGTAEPRGDAGWAARVLGVARTPPSLADSVLRAISEAIPGLRPFAYGSLADGLTTAIVGQSISVASAAVTQRRLAALFAPPLPLADRPFWPLPRPDQLAAADPALVRTSGVTTRRAAALVAAGQACLAGVLPSREDALADPEAATAALRRLPLVGPWTAASVLLWGLAADDVHPTGDIALLRAARLAYQEPDLDHPGLDRLAERWRPARSWAARLLWVDLLGVAG